MNLATILVLIPVILIIAGCVFSFFRKFRKGGSCCGVSVPSIPKKRLEHIKGQMVAQIDGMRCESCRRTVTQAINELEGASAKVSLEKQNAIIYYDRDIEKDTVIQAIESKGFIVTDLY